MDPVTQGLLGAAVVQATQSKKLGRDAWKIGAISGMAADLDIFIRSVKDPLLSVIYHRHFTHSLAFIPIGGLLVALLFFAWKKKYRDNGKAVLLACILGYATHAPLDLLTSYGTVLLWPFSDARFSLDFISVIDPVFTGILLIGVLWSFIKVKGRGARIALTMACFYMLFAVYQHKQAVNEQYKVALSRNHERETTKLVPIAASLSTWHSLYKHNGKIYFDAIHTPYFRKNHVEPGENISKLTLSYLLENDRILSQQINDFLKFSWFADGFVAYRPDKPDLIGDMRYVSQAGTTKALWGIVLDEPIKFINTGMPQLLNRAKFVWGSFLDNFRY